MTHSSVLSASTGQAPAVWSAPVFATIATIAHTVAGLVFPPGRQPSAEAGIRRAMADVRINDLDELVAAISRPGDVRDAVIAELTIGESYFFRDSSQLRVLAEEILPSRLASGNNTPLRIWSAGCAAGEEPYTLAIILRELAWTHGARILGTDISSPRLAAARRGRYSRWALRGLSEERIARWFARSGRSYDVDAAVRKAVQFATLNLVADMYPADTNGTAGNDLILCRNVMIYFDLDTVAKIARNLLASLSPDGWLIVGASDPMLNTLIPCDAIMTHAGIAYRHVGSAPPLSAWASERRAKLDNPRDVLGPVNVDRRVKEVPLVVLRPAGSPPKQAISQRARPVDNVEAAGARTAYDSGEYARAAETVVAALAQLPNDEAPATLWITGVRALSNLGNLAAAGELSARALEAQPLCAELHYLQAMLLAQGERFAESAQAARRAIYVDRQFIMGHMALGEALARLSEPVAAERSFANAQALLSVQLDDAAVPASDGVSAERLRQIAASRCDVLRQQHKRA